MTSSGQTETSLPATFLFSTGVVNGPLLVRKGVDVSISCPDSGPVHGEVERIARAMRRNDGISENYKQVIVYY
jgi:hypothetical protein